MKKIFVIYIFIFFKLLDFLRAEEGVMRETTPPVASVLQTAEEPKIEKKGVSYKVGKDFGKGVGKVVGEFTKGINEVRQEVRQEFQGFGEGWKGGYKSGKKSASGAETA